MRLVTRCHLAMLAMFTLMGVASGQTAPALTNDDIVKMVRAELSTSVILTTIDSATLNFDLSPTGLIGLKEAGVGDRIIEAMQAKWRARSTGTTTDPVTRSAPEKSELLATSKDPDYILRNFKTILVDATHAVYFGASQMKAALGTNKDFAALKIAIVDDPAVADVVLEVGHTFAWDYPFSVKHQNTSLVLVSGKGTGPFSGPLGAKSVASELVKLLRSYRVVTPQSAPLGR